MQLCGSLSILWCYLSLGLEWKWTFSSPEATAEFSKFAAILHAALPQHHLLGFEIAQLELHHLHHSWKKKLLQHHSSRFRYCWSLAWRILRITLLACELCAIAWQFEHSVHSRTPGFSPRLSFRRRLGVTLLESSLYPKLSPSWHPYCEKLNIFSLCHSLDEEETCEADSDFSLTSGVVLITSTFHTTKGVGRPPKPPLQSNSCMPQRKIPHRASKAGCNKVK